MSSAGEDGVWRVFECSIQTRGAKETIALFKKKADALAAMANCGNPEASYEWVPNPHVYASYEEWWGERRQGVVQGAISKLSAAELKALAEHLKNS